MSSERIWIAKRYFPERRIIAISLEVEGHPEFANRYFSLLANLNVKMLSCIVQSHPDRKRVNATVFLDMTASEAKPAELLDMIREIPYTVKAEMLDLPFTHGEARLVCFTLATMHHLFGMLRELGSGGEAIMYHMGYRAGAALAEKVGGYFGDNRRAVEFLLLYSESLGHGRFELRAYEDRDYCVVAVRNLVECVGVKSDKPNSHLFRGILAGFLSKLWNARVEVVEEECIAMGAAHCVFRARVRF